MPGDLTRYDLRGAGTTTAGLCEDDHELREIVKRALSGEGFAVEVTATGSAAVTAFSERPPDVLVLYVGFRMNAVLTFWLAYIMARLLGASIGDWLSQHSQKYGGLGLGTTDTSYLFLAAILVLVGYLTISKRDQTPSAPAAEAGGVA